MLKNLVGGSPSSERAGKSPRAAARKLRAVVESLEGRTMMSVAVMSVAVSGVAHRLIPIPAEVTKVTSSRVASNLASLAATTTIPLNFDTPLVKEISVLLENSGKALPDQNLEGRKALLLNYALVRYESSFGKTSNMIAIKWTVPTVYSTHTPSKDPTYFSNAFINNKNIKVKNAKADYYSYVTAGNPSSEFWVDFANKKLGGGVFTDGFLQEETMFLETPELANAAAQPATGGAGAELDTRTGGFGPLNGSPTPLVFMKANRVMDINPVLGKKPNKGDPREKEYWRTYPIAKLIENDVPLTNPQEINVLSMAAPYLPKNYQPKDPITKENVRDLFNTFVAGFSLAKTAAGGGNILINTGPIGAGGFNNNRIIVYVMQCLAARQVGVDLTFWGYKTDHTDGYNQRVDSIITAAGPSPTISHLLDVASRDLMTIK